MNFGPLEFAHYLRRKNDDRAGETHAVRAARAAAPTPLPLDAGRRTPDSGGGRSATRDAEGESEL